MFDGGESRGFTPDEFVNKLKDRALEDAVAQQIAGEAVPHAIDDGDKTEASNQVIEMEADLPPQDGDDLTPEITIEEGNDSEDGGEADAA